MRALFCLRYLSRYILHTFYGAYTNYIYSSAFLFNLSVLDILLLDFTRQLMKQASFRCPRPKKQDKKLKTHQIQPLLVLLPRDMYLNENQARHTVVIQKDSLPTSSVATQPKRKEIPTSPTRQETMTHATSAADTLVSQVTPLLGITPCESTQLQSTDTQEDV